MVKKNIIIFDWDGTLVSSEISKKANQLRAELIFDSYEKEELNRLMIVNDSHYELIQEVISKKTGIKNTDSIKTIQTIIFAYFYLTIFKKVKDEKLFFSMKELNEFKKRHNLYFVVCTALINKIINGCLEQLDLNPFDKVYGLDDKISKNKFDLIDEIVSDYKDDNFVCFVGDTLGDYKVAKRHSLKYIQCNYGLLKDEDINFKPDLIIDKPEQLKGEILKLL